jgi:predicted RND superfamily exporter protein
VTQRAPRPDFVERLDEAFGRLGAWSYDRRRWVLAACALLLALGTALSARLRFDNSMEAYFDTRDTTYEAYDRYRADFGSDELAYILYEAPGSPHGVFDLEVMRKIARLTGALEQEVPFVDEVTSLSNAEYVEGVADGIEVHDLLDPFPASQAELDVVRAKVLDKPLFVGSLVSRDGRYGAIIVDMDRSSVDPIDELRLDPDGGDGLANLYPQVSYHAIEEVLSRPEYEGIVFHHAGDVAMNAVYNELISEESDLLAALSLLVIGVLLALFFRRPIGVVGPLVVVTASVLVTTGAIALLGWKLDMFFIMLPTLLIAVGVADSVHIIAEFRALHADLGDRREAARRTLRLVGTPCLLTSLTTAVGFLSMTVSPIQAVAHFAVYSATGVVAAFLLSVTLLFTFLSFGRRRPSRAASQRQKIQAKGGRIFQAGLRGVALFTLRRRRAILAVFGGLFVFSLAGIAQLRVDSNFMTEFDRDEPVRRTTELVDDVMGGTASLVYLFDSGEVEGVKSPELLRDVVGLQEAADAHSYVVRKSYSLGDLLKDINKSFHEEDSSYYVLPETRDLVAQYLLVYEMSGGEELDSYVTTDFARTSLELRLRITETSVLGALADDLGAWLDQHPARGASVSATGMGALWLRLQTYITSSQIRSFGIAFGVIAALLCLLFRSLKTGLIAMVPNLSPVVLTLGVMGWMGLPLDYVRLLIASVAIGISVDDTIHHVTRFRLEFRRRGSYAEALRASMVDVGRALVITSVVLVAGFLVMLMSRLDSMQTFGTLLATTIGVALVADFLLMPALVLTFRPWGPERTAVRVESQESSLAAG